ncbi:benzoate/toluate 1,2-dioxygenase reductase subunit [Kribbella sp. VKM Ac-2527]|uniref:Benzoate/toluate 1,2-dioxygenase reductase subunit n=1 Tax=Kribbella caucasensis TaxID=2512215 RepID=A0A4R6KB49_9ACTN|nr:benzoate 1,2-dioxygenase electron transfer component BenC [Kribbella sp. VKM Ac-2527]TDO46648.1 benzoate/toluate 1,2-dioxygenase reductase subunit [Kribbella sp. VKM Ac-2527]
MSHQVALTFEDGVTRFITCAEDQTVADASYRARINIPLDCRDGACGTCKAFCESGEYDGGTYIEDAMTAGEAAAGYVLPCSMRPKSDLVLQIASTSAVAKTRATTYTGTLTSLEQLSPTTIALTIETPERDKLVFLPGQYVNIAVPGSEETRSYSFSNGPEDKQLTFLVKQTPGGLMSSYLTDAAAVGDTVTFTGPLGSFFLRETERPVLLLAGGTGLAPILSILRKLSAEGSRRPVHLVYGVTTDDDLVELETIEKLAASLPAFTWDYCVADAASSAPNKGYVTGLLQPQHLYDGDVAVYLCGPPAMVEAVRRHFTEIGMTPTGFYYEKFALSSPTDVPTARTDAAPDFAGQAEVLPAELAEAVPDATARSVAGQQVFGSIDLAPARSDVVHDPATSRRIAGQEVFASRPGGEPAELAPSAGDLVTADGARSIAGQELFAASGVPEAASVVPVTEDLYEIGEEHPSVQESDALFEARQALELGAVELTLGRLTSQQLAGYRLLAESTLPYVQGDRFVDAAAYTEANAAFHDYLFTLTGNEHLLQAYHALGVKGRMSEVLRNATWCHPRCASDHVEIVAAFETADRDTVRRLVAEHAERSKITMRRAMADNQERRRPAYISPGRFDGLVVLVTGAAQGIGEATARRISAEGGAVVLADRSELVNELAGELARAGREALATTADLETWPGAEATVAAALERFGRIDVAVHTVGGTIWAKPFWHYPADQIEAEVNRSLYPTLWSCRAVVPHMVERGQGTIVNVSSVATRGLNRVPYAAAKGGVNAITTALAMEVAPYGVRVVATAPGGTDAPQRRIPRGPAPASGQEQDWYRTIVDQTVGSSFLKRYGTLDEQAAAITFLASPEASYITGTVLPVAGGDLG